MIWFKSVFLLSQLLNLYLKYLHVPGRENRKVKTTDPQYILFITNTHFTISQRFEECFLVTGTLAKAHEIDVFLFFLSLLIFRALNQEKHHQQQRRGKKHKMTIEKAKD
jgi:hypothetical protein